MDEYLLNLANFQDTAAKCVENTAKMMPYHLKVEGKLMCSKY